MRYVLCVKQPAYGKQGGFLAYQLAKALLEKGHQITQVFFFQEGSHMAMRSFIPRVMNLIYNMLGNV